MDALLVSAAGRLLHFCVGAAGYFLGVQALSQSTKGRSGSERRGTRPRPSDSLWGPARGASDGFQPEGAFTGDAAFVLSSTAKRRGQGSVASGGFDAAGRQVLKDLWPARAFRAALQLSRHYFTHFRGGSEWIPQVCARRCVRRFCRLAEGRLVEADGGRTIKRSWRPTARRSSRSLCYPQRTTLCVSSQAVRYGVPVLRDRPDGVWTRNLSTAEIVDRVATRCRVPRRRAGGGPDDSVEHRVHDGEPLANYKTVIGALHRLIDPAPEGFWQASARNITVSGRLADPAIRSWRGGMVRGPCPCDKSPGMMTCVTLIPINSRRKVVTRGRAACDHRRV